MKQALITALETVCPNQVYLQGTYDANAAYPDTFITFWTNYTKDRAHFENEVKSIDWDFSVNVYSNDPATLETKITGIRTAMKAAGFIPQGRGHDLPCDAPTHTGWTIEFIKSEIIQ